MTHPVPASSWRRRSVVVAAVALGALAAATLNSGLVGAGRAFAQAPAGANPATFASTQATPGAAAGGAGATVTGAAKAVSPAPAVGSAAAAITPSPPAVDTAGDDDDDQADDANAKPAGSGKHSRGATLGVTFDDNQRMHVSGFGKRHDYDSFQDFAQSAPWLAGLIFLSVTLSFLVPLLVIVLLIWYKMRKNRMLNETMLKLAEKGVMPPAEAMAAIGAGASPASATPATSTLYEQARALRDRRTWSDLRRGIILGAVGLGFQAYSLIDAGEANWAGLICMFLGAGYVLLWFFEDRRPMGPPSGGA